MTLAHSHSMAALGAFLLAAATTPAVAQERVEEEQGQKPTQERVRHELGKVGESPVGEVGQRQTRDQAQTHIKPMARINNRIGNRVQNRIRNRIDRYYDPSANATSPFEVAAEQSRSAGSQTQR